MMIFFFFKQKTAYELRISDWSSDVCSSDLQRIRRSAQFVELRLPGRALQIDDDAALVAVEAGEIGIVLADEMRARLAGDIAGRGLDLVHLGPKLGWHQPALGACQQVADTEDAGAASPEARRAGTEGGNMC